jgi:hypothetical protein
MPFPVPFDRSSKRRVHLDVWEPARFPATTVQIPTLHEPRFLARLGVHPKRNALRGAESSKRFKQELPRYGGGTALEQHLGNVVELIPVGRHALPAMADVRRLLDPGSYLGSILWNRPGHNTPVEDV